MHKARISFIVLGLLLVASVAMGDVVLPHIFSDHMVVQQKTKIPVWGKASPGERVTVELGKRKASAKCGDDGCWMVKLGALPAGGPLELRVTSDAGSDITIQDVLVGEVWVCSGQSNMVWWVKNSNDAEQEIAAGNYPQIRNFMVPNVVALEPKDDCEGAWAACSPEVVGDWSAVAYYFGRMLHKELGVPIGLIQTAWGGTPSESWTSLEMLQGTPEAKPLLARWDDIVAKWPETQKNYEAQLEQWNQAVEQAKADGKEPPKKPRPPVSPTHPHRPSVLYNAMIAPIIPYGVQGAIWYQGESNASRAYQYRTIFPAMIEDWRERWGQKHFPFIFVQLANFLPRQEEPQVESAWAELREAQLMTLDLPETGMAVIIDIGEADNIHPKNKQDVGKRLALWALANTYKQKIPYSGPMYKSMRVEDGKIRLTFDHTDGGLVARDGAALTGFAIAGADQKFVWAKATIDGDTVVVSSDEVAAPVAVRYAWADNPACNLYNGAGLPASPFRTDEWQGCTANNF